jgi:hypothetical protein
VPSRLEPAVSSCRRRAWDRAPIPGLRCHDAPSKRLKGHLSPIQKSKRSPSCISRTGRLLPSFTW